MLNKNEFTGYAKALLTCCGVTYRDDSDNQVTYYSRESDAVALADAVFSTQESYLTFTSNNTDIGSMVLSMPLTTGDFEPSTFIHSSAFTCSDASVPNMRHFVESPDTTQDNRAAITKYLAALLQDYSLGFGESKETITVNYDRNGDYIELADHLFNSKTSCLSINKDGEQIGSIHFAGEYNEKRFWKEGEPYDFLDVYAYSSNECRALLPNKVVAG